MKYREWQEQQSTAPAKETTAFSQQDNEQLLNAVVKNTELGKNTLAELIPLAKGQELKNEMFRQQKEYRRINQQAHTAMAAIGAEAKGQSAMAKMNVSMGIKMKTMRDSSPRALAEMMTLGSTQGVIQCTEAAADHPGASSGAKQMNEELRNFEENAMSRWKQFL